MATEEDEEDVLDASYLLLKLSVVKDSMCREEEVTRRTALKCSYRF